LPPTHQTYCTKKDSAVPYQYVASYVDKYDPQQEIVVAISFPGGHVYTSICSILNVYPLAKEEALLMSFIHHNWIVLAAMAWHGYQDNGKGFLYLDNLPPSKNLVLTQVPWSIIDRATLCIGGASTHYDSKTIACPTCPTGSIGVD
jgi:hypothetical protein